MKAILEFNLPEEQKDFNRCNKATDMAIVLFELVSNKKKRLENRVLEGGMDGYDTLELVFNEIGDLLDRYGLIIDDLIE